MFSENCSSYGPIFYVFSGEVSSASSSMPSSSSLLIFSFYFSLQLLFKEYICEQCPEISQDMSWHGIFYLLYFGRTLCGCFQCRICSWIYLMIFFPPFSLFILSETSIIWMLNFSCWLSNLFYCYLLIYLLGDFFIFLSFSFSKISLCSFLQTCFYFSKSFFSHFLIASLICSISVHVPG